MFQSVKLSLPFHEERSSKVQWSFLQSFFFSCCICILFCAIGCISQDIKPLGTLSTISDAGDRFGYSVSTSGDTIVVGAYYESSNATGVNGDQNNDGARESGAAYVFVRSGGTTWTQQAYLKASNAETNDQFGYSVSISEDTIVVGARYEDSDATGVNGDEDNNDLSASGAAYVFVRSGTTWTQQAYLKASDPHASDNFGFAVSISGNRIAVGALDAGAVYVFVRSGSTWSQEDTLKATDGKVGDQFGDAVSISGDTIVVGAPGEDSAGSGVNTNWSPNGAPDSGAVYVYVRDRTFWTEQARFKASNSAMDYEFGDAVSISGDTIVVGSWGENVDGTEAGAAYVFERNGTTWTQEKYLKASNVEARDFFGTSVSISGDTIVVGANGEDSNATGVNGDETDNDGPGSGAAYVFVRNGADWDQVAYLKASEAVNSGNFGFSVSVDKHIAVGQEENNKAYAFSGTTSTSGGSSGGSSSSTSTAADTTGADQITSSSSTNYLPRLLVTMLTALLYLGVYY